MRRSIVWAIILTCQFFPAWAETISCKNANVSVNARQSAHVEMACKAAEHAEALFSQCNLLPFADQIRIEIVNELKPGCVALYHCGSGRIEVLEPSLMEPVRESEGAFAFLAVEDYFQSVVVHEMAHAIFDNTPCPFGACVATSEYVAYNMQVMSLVKDAQTAFEAKAGLDRKISRDELSAMILFMAPNLFAQKAWVHLNQRNDPCAFIGQIMDGAVLLDVERF